jgi:hypothetical protein
MEKLETLLEPSLSKINQLDMKELYKMAFIYNAIQDGWVVQKNVENKIEMRKNKEEIDFDSFLCKTMDNYMNLNRLKRDA